MSKISNPRRIRPEDYDKDDRDLITKLGLILNTFMEEIVENMTGNIDFDNLKQEIIEYTIIPNSSGIPTTTKKIKSKFSSIHGIVVINVVNQTNATNYPSQLPAVYFTGDGTGIYTINKVTSLTTGQKYKLTLQIIGK